MRRATSETNELLQSGAAMCAQACFSKQIIAPGLFWFNESLFAKMTNMMKQQLSSWLTEMRTRDEEFLAFLHDYKPTGPIIDQHSIK